MTDSWQAIDVNERGSLTAVSTVDDKTIVRLVADPITGALVVTTSGGSGITIIAVTGVIDDSNVTFTAASEPTVLVINGGVYQKTGGAITWTYLAGTITLSSPVGVGGSIFGIA